MDTGSRKATGELPKCQNQVIMPTHFHTMKFLKSYFRIFSNCHWILGIQSYFLSQSHFTYKKKFF